jgi:hypothetical protein
MWDTAAIGAISEELVTRDYLSTESRATIEARYGSLVDFITGGRTGISLSWFAALVVASMCGPILAIRAGLTSSAKTSLPAPSHPR